MNTSDVSMNVLMITYPLSAIIIVALAFGTGQFLSRKLRLEWRWWWIGAATFVLAQIGHIPFNWILTILFQRQILPSPPVEWRQYFNPVVLGLSAGLWETTARWSVLRWWAREARSWGKGVMLGAGHGGIEAALTGSLILVNFIVMASMRGSEAGLLAPGQEELVRRATEAYWSISPALNAAAVIERAFTILSHIFLYSLVLQVFIRGQARWFWLAAAFHSLMDMLAVYSSLTWGVWISETILFVFAFISFAGILALRHHGIEPKKNEPPPLDTPQVFVLPEPEETLENLEKTRYQ